ncbi:hypothetical protein ACFQ58_16535 [Agromyces sp. NPDC056523]|uniref:hypothetical protein n=1 Tax=Agromyces sp. NPDC056523 TaxID=3345850 RepID=UPI003671CD2A
MSLPILLDDALVTTPDGIGVRLSLPWIRSLPLTSVSGLEVRIDGAEVAGLRIRTHDEWWFLQDRLVVEAPLALSGGRHDVSVSFRLTIPYLQAGPDGPLVLPFHAERALVADVATGRDASAPGARGSNRVSQAADRIEPDGSPALPGQWTLAASAFNWTPEVIRAERAAPDIAVDIVADGIASVIELEPGQLWRSFPEPDDAEVDELRRRLDATGGRVSIVGASLDDWVGPSQRRSDAERLAFLVPQLRAAQRVGADGVRLPIGQAGAPLLRQLLPVLHDLDLVLYEEIQGQQTPDSPAAASAIETIAALDDPRLRVLVDISMLMPALPTTYLERMAAACLPRELLARLADEWREPATAAAVVEHLRSGAVPPAVHAMYMNLIVRFGRSDAAVLRDILPLIGAFHLKFWDLDDADARVSQPIRDLGALLAGSGFGGTLASEWGGHEWLDPEVATPGDMTRRHLALATAALAEGATTAAPTSVM